MTTLFDLTLAVSRKLAVLRTGVATGGSTTTTVDSLRREVDDSFNGGTVWNITNSEYARVTDFANATGTITHPAITSVDVGDSYGVATRKYPLDIMISAINNEVIKYKAPRYDATTLDVVAKQSEYTLPAGITKYNLINVYESTNDDSDDNRWVPLTFEVQPDTAGQQHTLIIHSRRVSTGNDFLLEYDAWCSPMTDASDVLDESIAVPRIVVHAAAHCVLMVMQTESSSNDLDEELWKMLVDQAKDADARYPVRPTRRKGNVMEAGGRSKSSNMFTYPSTS